MSEPGTRTDAEQHIAARMTIPGQVTTSPFGPDDEIGMLNLVTPESRRQSFARADPGRLFDLSVEYFMGMPTWTAAGEPPYQIWMAHTPAGTVADDPLSIGRRHNEYVSWSADALQMFTHTGTHLDTLNHFGYDGLIWNGFSAAEHLGSRHWRVGGAEKFPVIMSRGVLLDVPPVVGVEVLPDSYGIGVDDIRGVLDRQGIALETGDVVLVRTGRMRHWPDPASYLPREPGITREGAEFLAEHGAMVIGADNVALEQLPSADENNWMPVHTFLLAEAGIPIMEVANLEELAAEGLHEFILFAACMPLRGATGTPVRPVAMPLKSDR